MSSAPQILSHGCALYSCVEILRYEMTDKMGDQQMNHEVAAGVLVDDAAGSAPVALEIPDGETSQSSTPDPLISENQIVPAKESAVLQGTPVGNPQKSYSTEKVHP